MKLRHQRQVIAARLLCMSLLLAATLVGQTSTVTPKSTAATTRKKASKAAAQPAITAADLQALKDALAAQQQQIQRLEQHMQEREVAFQQAQQQAQQQLQQAQSAAADAQSKAASLESAAVQEQASLARLSTDLVDVKSSFTGTARSTEEGQKRLAALEGVLGRFRLSGDIRIRGESFFQNYSGCDATAEAAGKGPICADRNRARIRVRFGVDGRLNEDFSGGLALATGSLGDPTSTNENFTNFFDRKTIALDRGYIAYNPVAHNWLSLTAGKFAYPWLRTSLTLDPDINPEGFDEKFSWDFHGPVLKKLTVQSMQLLINENSTATFLNAADTFAAGGQVSGDLKLGPVTSTLAVTALNFRNVDALLNASAFAVQATTTGSGGATPAGPFNVPGEGPGCSSGAQLSVFPPCAIAANKFTNATFIGPDGKTHLASQFLYGDLILNNQVQTGIARLPLNLMLEAEQNLRAAGHPIGANNAVDTSLGRQSHAYLIDASLGQLKNRNDVRFGYSFWRIEQDAIIATWAESEQRAPTNILQHRVYALWKVRPNLVAGSTLWIGRTLNENLQHAVLAPGWTSKLGSAEPNLKRLQFDLIYSY